MLRAATAASGGTGRPVRDVLLDLGLDRAHQRLDLDAVGRLVGELLDARREVRRGLSEAVDAHAGLALDDGADGAVLELDDLGDLGERADAVQLGRVVDVLLVRPGAGSRARSGPPSATAALSAATLFSRPTWSGTIISGKMTVSRSATSGSSRSSGAPVLLLLDSVFGRSLGHRVSLVPVG